ncbi:hypothetical protein GCM10027047_22960 [Rhodococcus aerolatus]
MLVDADNLDVARLRLVAAALRAAPPGVRVVVGGRPARLAALAWPPTARQLAATGWQRADLALAEAYEPDRAPLVLVSGDGDFVHLAARHAGPVLVVAARPSRSAAHREGTVHTDPATEGTAALVRWLRGDLG